MLYIVIRGFREVKLKQCIGFRIFEVRRQFLQSKLVIIREVGLGMERRDNLLVQFEFMIDFYYFLQCLIFIYRWRRFLAMRFIGCSGYFLIWFWKSRWQRIKVLGFFWKRRCVVLLGFEYSCLLRQRNRVLFSRCVIRVRRVFVRVLRLFGLGVGGIFVFFAGVVVGVWFGG